MPSVFQLAIIMTLIILIPLWFLARRSEKSHRKTAKPKRLDSIGRAPVDEIKIPATATVKSEATPGLGRQNQEIDHSMTPSVQEVSIEAPSEQALRKSRILDMRLNDLEEEVKRLVHQSQREDASIAQEISLVTDISRGKVENILPIFPINSLKQRPTEGPSEASQESNDEPEIDLQQLRDEAKRALELSSSLLSEAESVEQVTKAQLLRQYLLEQADNLAGAAKKDQKLAEREVKLSDAIRKGADSLSMAMKSAEREKLKESESVGNMNSVGRGFKEGAPSTGEGHDFEDAVINHPEERSRTSGPAV